MSGVIKTCLFRAPSMLVCKSFHVTSVRQNSTEKILFNLAGFHKYGLLHDDLLNEMNSDVAEAIRRLPESEQIQRLHRAIRAQQAELNKSILPEDQWTKFEDNHDYLQPYLKEVIAEREEREEWEATH